MSIVSIVSNGMILIDNHTCQELNKNAENKISVFFEIYWKNQLFNIELKKIKLVEGDKVIWKRKLLNYSPYY